MDIFVILHINNGFDTIALIFIFSDKVSVQWHQKLHHWILNLNSLYATHLHSKNVQRKSSQTKSINVKNASFYFCSTHNDFPLFVWHKNRIYFLLISLFRKHMNEQIGFLFCACWRDGARVRGVPLFLLHCSNWSAS